MNADLAGIEIGFLLEVAFKSTVILGGAFAGTRLARRRAAEERHVAWAVALASLLVLPVLALSCPQLRMPANEFVAPIERFFASFGEMFSTREGKLSAVAVTANDGGASDPHNERQRRQSDDAASGTERSNAAITGGVTSASRILGSTAEGQQTNGVGVLLTALFSAAASAAAVAYLLVGGLLLAYFGAAALRVTISLRRLPELADPGIRELLETAREQQGIRRRVGLKASEADVTPWAWGVLRPVVVVPGRFATLPAEAQRDALVHELAHIARFDFVTTLLGCTVCALYWFQPLAWLALRRMALETERACDDRVLLAGGIGTSYAAELLETAQAIRGFRRPMAATAMARSSAVSARIASILDSNVRRTAVSKKYVALVSLLATATLVPIASLKSQEAEAPHPADTAASVPTDLDDPAFLAVVQRGPANDDELRLVVDAYIARDRQADAADVLANYISGGVDASGASSPAQAPAAKQLAIQRTAVEASCKFCAEALEGPASAQGAGSETARAVLAAFDEVEHRARQDNDGDLLVRLAMTCAASGDRSFIDRGTYYLVEGFRLGHLSEASSLAAISFLIQRGWDTEAKELAQRLYDDASSGLYRSTVLQNRIRMLEGRIAQRGNIAKRLLTPNASITFKDDGDVIPVYRQPPVYPPSALKQHLEGMAQLEFTVTDEGKTKGITVVDATHDEFGQSAVESVSHWLYAPDVSNGVAVERPGVHTVIRFVLAD